MSKSNAAKAEKPTKEEKPKKDKLSTIHHATMNKAIENEVKFEDVPSGFRAVHVGENEEGEEVITKVIAPTAKEALDKVLAKLNPPAEGEEGEEEGKVVVREKYKKKYQPNGGNCGDALAKTLTTFRATGPEAFKTVCDENKVDPTRWEGKNKGLQWMALSNILRHRVKRKEEVTINGEKITSL